MFESFRRTQLQKEGLCGRTRRKHQEDDFMESLRSHPLVMAVIMAGFVVGVLLLMQVAGGLAEGIAKPGLTDSLYAGAFAAAVIIHLHIGHQYLKEDNRHVLLVLGTLLLHLGAVLAAVKFGMKQGWGGGLLVLTLPHAIAPLVFSVVRGRRLGLFGAFHASLLGSVVCLPVTQRLTFLASSVLVGFLAVVATRRVRRRNRLFIAGCYVGLTAAAFSFLLALAESGARTASWSEILGWPLLSGVLTGMAVGGLLPVIESVFEVTTDITWLELADLNHPLMRRLSMEAPGTYHHSLMVANIAEAAAEAIGASATMCRVCSYFHDIGKLNKPEYFIENMDPADNPHKDLTARMSALVLIAHVKDGVDLAIKSGLNSRIIDVIEQHHGTSLAWYFYRRALDQKAEVLRLVQQDKATEDDVPQVSEDVFRYPGPKPNFRESAIISLADAVESTSRTLDKPNPGRIEAMVDELVWNRLMDGQLDDCDLTINELAKVKGSFVKSLVSMMHSRIKYQSRRVEKDEPVAEGKVVPMEPAPNPPTTQIMLDDSPFGEPRKRKRPSGGKPTSAA
jgi:putative nucleotidyltransferase with HDIG domain